MGTDKDNGGIFTTEGLTVLKIQLRRGGGQGGKEKEEKNREIRKTSSSFQLNFHHFYGDANKVLQENISDFLT